MSAHRDLAPTIRARAMGVRLLLVSALLALLAVTGLAIARPVAALSLISNPGFEDPGLASWTHYHTDDGPYIEFTTFWRNTQWAHSGSFSAGIANRTPWPQFYVDLHQGVSAEENKTYTAGTWFVTDRNRDAVALDLCFYSSQGSYLGEGRTNGSLWSMGADSWTHMEVTAIAPPGTTMAIIRLRLDGGTYTGPGGGSSKGEVCFDDVTIVEQIPVMDSLSPTSGHVGETVIIKGSHFGAPGRVLFGGIDAVVNSWSDSEISATVPDWLNPGVATVMVQNFMGFSAYALNFTVTEVPPPPALSRLTPKRARVGRTITLIGSRFGAKRGTSVVKFGVKAATSYVSWRDTRIKVKVPKGTRKGIVRVSVVTPAGKSARIAFKRL